ncbi:MAG: hypothetical protein GEEBNDBF_00919 [bacterium]|nr:hypothetical protein [bacterium]
MRYPASPPLVTTLGSLPFTDPQRALAVVRRASPAFPTWPQLSQRSPQERFGQSVIRILPGALPTEGGGRLLVIPEGVQLTDWDADLHRAREAEEALSRQASGYAAFREALSAGQFGIRPRVKSPLPGPITLASLLEQPDGAPVLENEAEVLRLGRLIGALGVAIALEFRERGAGEVDVWLDEPAWNLALEEGTLRPAWRSMYQQLIGVLKQADVRVGIHCCAGTSFATFGGLGLDVLSFDAAHYLPQLLEALPLLTPEILAGRLEIAWGVIDTWEPDAPVDVGLLVEAWLTMINGLEPGLQEACLRRPIVTPACGLGLLSIPQAELILARLLEFSNLLAAKAVHK